MPKSALTEFEAARTVQEAAIGDIENRLALRKRFLAGEISAAETGGPNPDERGRKGPARSPDR